MSEPAADAATADRARRHRRDPRRRRAARVASPSGPRSCRSVRPDATSGSRPSRSSRSGRSRSAAPTTPRRRCSPEDRARGLITYSSGNHAQGVARAARLLGVPAAIVMPSDAPAVKRARVEADGAQVVVVGPASDERRRVAEELASSRGPRDHPALRRPRGSWPGRARSGSRSPRTCPMSRRSSSRSAAAAWPRASRRRSRALAPNARVIGVEPELAADARESLAEGRIVAWPAELVEPDDRGRDAHAVDRRAQLRPPPRPARRRRHRLRARDRGGRPARGRGGAPGRRAIGRAVDRGDAVPRRGGGPARARRTRSSASSAAATSTRSATSSTCRRRSRPRRRSARRRPRPAAAGTAGRAPSAARRAASLTSRSRIAARSPSSRRSSPTLRRSSARIHDPGQQRRPSR